MFKVFFPECKCVVCDLELEEINSLRICESCKKLLEENDKKFCLRCGRKLLTSADYCNTCRKQKYNFERAISPFVYQGKMVGIIHKFKYANARYLCDLLSSYMCNCYMREKLQADVVVCVPQSFREFWVKGYNQSALLAKSLSRKISCDFIGKVLKKVKHTKRQAGMSKKQRENNLKDCFAVNEKLKHQIKGKTILIVDDVLTTGATLNECAKVLIKAGAKKIYGICACSTKELSAIEEKKDGNTDKKI